MLYDLHIHSSYSDGEHEFDEILNNALMSKLKGFCITDHNGIHPDIKIFNTKTQQHRIEILEGIEISTIFRNNESPLSLHVLGYSLNFDSKLLNTELTETILGYQLRALKIIAKCKKLGIPIDYYKLITQSKAAYISRNTIAKEIIKYLNISFKEALKMAFIKEKEDWFLETAQAISLIQEAGGIPVLAHPGKILSKLGKKSFESLIKEFIINGLRGIEVFYPSHKLSEINNLLDIAKKHKLIITGGTDYHGLSVPPYSKIGTNGINSINFNKLKLVLLKTNKSRNQYYTQVHYPVNL